MGLVLQLLQRNMTLHKLRHFLNSMCSMKNEHASEMNYLPITLLMKKKDLT